MGQQLFVPLTDDLMYDTPEMITSGLTPYNVDAPCYHWQVELDGGVAKECDRETEGKRDSEQSGNTTTPHRTNIIPFPNELTA